MGVTVTGMRRLTATLDESLVPQGMTDARAQGLAMLRDQSLSHDEVLTEPRPGVLSLAREMIWLHPVDAHQPSARGRSCPTPKSSSRI
jgi:hypothetical protein